MGGKDYNRRNMTFATTANTNEYIDSAIARNIQHSLRNYQYGGHFRDLQELYDAGELTNAINRIVEDMGHRFTREVIQRALNHMTWEYREITLGQIEEIQRTFWMTSIQCL